MNLEHKVLDFQVREVGNPEERTLEFKGSDATVDRYGDIVDVKGWDVKNFQKNPVILFAHNYSQPPVGKALKVAKGDDGLTFQVYFPTDDEINAAGWPDNHPTPETVYRLYKGGIMKAVSVGFQGLASEPILGQPDDQGYKPRTGTHYTKQELYELSCVPVPANPNAVMMAVQKGIISEEQARAFQSTDQSTNYPKEKGVIPFKAYSKADEGESWDGPAEVKAASVDALKIMCTWFDDTKPDVKGSYKLPHHKASGYAVVWKGVAAAMGALLGARGGANIPDADRKGCYNHLVKHYAQFEKTPPEFKAYGEVNLRLIALGINPISEDAEKAIQDQLLDGLKETLTETLAQFNIKSGAVLSAKNKEKLQKCVGHMKDAQQHCQDVLDACKPGEETGAPESDQKPSYYRTALNPGEEPPGARQAEAPEIPKSLGEKITAMCQEHCS